MSKPIIKTDRGTYSLVLYLKEDEYRTLKDLSDVLKKNDYDTIKYAIQLVSWWSHGKIEPEQEE